jgi:adrenodoxin-NADP+ reductase
VARSYSVQTTTHRPLRLAVVGSGPAGFYSSFRVLNKLQDATVDMYEALPVPFGLVRYGVAPDHPEVKVRFRSYLLLLRGL